MRFLPILLAVQLPWISFATNSARSDNDDGPVVDPVFARMEYAFSRYLTRHTSTPVFSEVADRLNLKLSKIKTRITSNRSYWTISNEADSESIDRNLFSLKYLAQTGSSGIWYATTADGSKRRVIKYTNNCSGKRAYMERCGGGEVSSNFVPDAPASIARDSSSSDPSCRLEFADLDPLVDEFVIMNVLGSFENSVVPRAYSLSLSRPFATGETSIQPKILAEPHKDTTSIWSDCTTIGARYRGILEDLVGADMLHVFSAKQSNPSQTKYFQDVLMMGRRIVGAMWRFHDLGFIHGDFHDGNVAFKTKKDKLIDYNPFNDEVILIDFGYSRFIPNEYGTPPNQPWNRGLNEQLLSFWHLENNRIGRRDDLFRLMEAIVDMLELYAYGSRYTNRYPKADEGRSDGYIGKLIQAKKNWGFFSATFSDDVKAPGKSFKDVPKKAAAMWELANALDLIRSIKFVDDRPPYEAIIVNFERAILMTMCGGPELESTRNMLLDLRDIDSKPFSIEEEIEGRREEADPFPRGIFQAGELIDAEKTSGKFERLIRNFSGGSLSPPRDLDVLDELLNIPKGKAQFERNVVVGKKQGWLGEIDITKLKEFTFKDVCSS